MVLLIKNCDLLISNPPFSQQNDIIKRVFQLMDDGFIKSFCLLLPFVKIVLKFRLKNIMNQMDVIIIKGYMRKILKPLSQKNNLKVCNIKLVRCNGEI